MVKAGCLDGIDEIYGYHNVPNFDEGDIRVCEGPIFAQVNGVKISITGQGGHGSSPHKIHDPINAACQILNALHSIKARNLDSAKNIVFTICGIQAGSTYNVFPDEAVLMGTIRSFDKPTLERMMERIHEIS